MNVIPFWGTIASLYRLNKAGILFTLSAKEYGNANDSTQGKTACNLCEWETFFGDGVSAAGRLAGPGVGEVPPPLLMCYKPPSCELA